MIWPNISEDIREYLETVAVLCRRRIEVDQKNGAYLKLFHQRILLIHHTCILTLENIPFDSGFEFDTYGCLEVHEKKAENITALLDVWSEPLGLDLHELTFLTDRGKELEDMDYFKFRLCARLVN